METMTRGQEKGSEGARSQTRPKSQVSQKHKRQAHKVREAALHYTHCLHWTFQPCCEGEQQDMAATRRAGVRCGARLSNLFCTAASSSSNVPPSSSAPGLGVEDFLRAVGKGVEVHADKMAKEAGSFSNFLRFRGGSLKGLGIPCQQRKLILRYIEKYRQGTWKPRAT